MLSKPLLLIPGYYCVGVNMHAKVHDAIKGVPKIVTWDQSLLTVEINTITLVMPCVATAFVPESEGRTTPA